MPQLKAVWKGPVFSSLLYAAFICAFCGWVLSLPLFPTQDGPVHRYYIHVFDSLLRHGPTYRMYAIRHPFPPYATQYLLLLLLSKVFAYNLAEKLFVCFSIGCFAYGLRLCARISGPAGEWISLLATPLFLPWTLMVGFFNYYLGSGLFLFAAAFWQMAGRGRKAYWAAFAATVLVVTFTHPVPLLLLLAVCSVDLLLGGFRHREASANAWVKANAARVIALFFAVCAFLFPASLLGRQQIHSVFEGFGFHLHFVTTSLLLMGVSPYYTRSTSLSINLYRLSLYALLLFCLPIAYRAMRGVVRQRSFGLSSTFFVCGVLLALLLPLAPDRINGTVYFTTRLVPMLWVAAMMAASGSTDKHSPRMTAVIPVLATAFAAATLLPAELFLHPVARELRTAELQPMPRAQAGVVLIGYGFEDYVRTRRQLAFNPFGWATLLSPFHNDDVVLDSPWLNQNIIPITAAPGSPLTRDEITDAPFRKVDPPSAYGRSLSASKETQTMDTSNFVFYEGTPQELAHGLSVQLDKREAERFRCTGHGWYLLCLTAPNL